MRQAVAVAKPMGSLFMERQLVGRVDGLATTPASRADGSWQQWGCLLDGVYRLYKVRTMFTEMILTSFNCMFLNCLKLFFGLFCGLIFTDSTTLASQNLSMITHSFLWYHKVTPSFRLFHSQLALLPPSGLQGTWQHPNSTLYHNILSTYLVFNMLLKSTLLWFLSQFLQWEAETVVSCEH